MPDLCTKQYTKKQYNKNQLTNFNGLQCSDSQIQDVAGFNIIVSSQPSPYLGQ